MLDQISNRLRRPGITIAFLRLASACLTTASVGIMTPELNRAVPSMWACWANSESVGPGQSALTLSLIHL